MDNKTKYKYLKTVIVSLLSIFILLVSIPINAQEYNFNSVIVNEYNNTNTTSDLMIEESFSESEDNFIIPFLLNKYTSTFNNKDNAINVKTLIHLFYDIIIPPPEI